MIIHKHRLAQGCTQQELAQHSGLSIRTVQRIEKGQLPSEESAKCLGAVFSVEYQDILDHYAHCQKPANRKSQHNTNEFSLDSEEERVIREVEDLKWFYEHALCFALIMPILWLINFVVSTAYWWAIWPTLVWGVGLALHGISTFNLFKLFGPEWERREINKRLQKRK
ncbi:MAG: 2TM domain-containing protein [Pseudomonadales bacterium]|jgi:transcriptional regulator with XRE-family HTH domain